MADEDKKEVKESEEANSANEDEDSAEGEEGEGKSGKGKKKLLIMIIAGALLAGGAVGGGIYFFMSGEEEPEITEEIDPTAEITDVAFFDMPQLSADMLSTGRVGHKLKLKISLELSSEKDIPAIELVLPRIQDDFLTFMRQMRIDDIRGAAGMFKLKENLLLRANQSAAPVKIRNVLFKEINIK